MTGAGSGDHADGSAEAVATKLDELVRAAASFDGGSETERAALDMALSEARSRLTDAARALTEATYAYGRIAEIDRSRVLLAAENTRRTADCAIHDARKFFRRAD